MQITAAKLLRVFFRKDDFLIGRFANGSGEFAAKGVVFEPQIGLAYDLTGDWETHPKYGQQFAIEQAIGCEPEEQDIEAVVDYLVDHAPWAGKATARRIVETFGKDALRVCKEEPSQVAEKVPGITTERAKEMADALNKRRDLERSELEVRRLVGQFVSKSVIQRIRSRYGRSAKKAILENPYRLVYEIDGVGFPTADTIARHLGLDLEDPRRIAAGIYYTLYEGAWGHGHVCVPYQNAVSITAALLGVSTEVVDKRVVAMSDEDKPVAVFDDGYLYLSRMHKAEVNVAARLKSLMQADPRVKVWTEDDYRQAFVAASERAETVLSEEEIASAIPQSHKALHEDQAAALDMDKSSPVFILCGPPGSGKTTCLKAIIESFGPDAKVALCAPSGKAAKRMTEQTGREASTIHRLLEANPTDDGGWAFSRNADNPLSQNVIVVDEVSMVDILLMSSLLNAVKTGSRVLLVGDVHQLPSVGPGSVLRDLMASGVVPAVELVTIKRQNPGGLLKNIHRIKNGEEIDFSSADDFLFVEENDVDKVQATVVELAATIETASGEPLDRLRDVQVITALREKTAIGCKALNEALRCKLNPGEDEEGYQFRPGDKVIQTKNKTVQDRRNGETHYVVNGDIGYVEENIERPACTVINFESPDRQIGMLRKSVDMSLAYAITVHRAQGSEFNVVILPVHKAFGKFMLQRTWIYTALSRASTLCVVVGQREAVREAIMNNVSIGRHSCLERRMCEACLVENP